MDDRIAVVFDFLDHWDTFNIDDPQSAGLEPCSEKHSVGVAWQAETGVVGRVGEFVSLFELVRVPYPNRMICWQSDHWVGKFVVRYLSDFFSMGSYDSFTIVSCQVEDVKCTNGCTTGYFRGVFTKRNIGYDTIIGGFQSVLRKVHRPNSKQLVFTTSHTKSCAYCDTRDSCIVM